MKRGLLWARLQVAVLAFMGLLGLPAFSPYIGAGLDSSWAIAVSLAASRHMAFGRSLIFSYGPLGFLATPAFVVPDMGVVSVWLRIGFAFLLGWLIARSVLAVAPIWATAIITVVSVWALGGAFALGGEAVLVPLVLLLGGLIDLLATTKTPIRPVISALLGVLAGTMLLTKFDTGVWGLLVLLAALVLHGRSLRLGFGGTLRRVGLAVAGFVGGVLIWWGVLSQPISALGPWLRGSTEVLLGYDRAMVANGGLWWELPAALVACAVALVLSWLLTPVGRRSYVCLFLLVASWLFTKQSFIRHDNGHVVRIFVLLSFCLLLLLGARRRWATASAGPLELAAPKALGSELLDPETDVGDTAFHQAVFDQSVLDQSVSDETGQATRSTRTQNKTVRVKKVRNMAMGSDRYAQRIWSVTAVTVVGCLSMVLHLTTYGRLRTALPDTAMIPRAVGWLTNANQIEINHAVLQKDLDIGSELRRELLKGSVHIEPSETSVVLGIPELKWNPLPVPQSYSAYTPWLDGKNAAALASASGPEQVLYEASSVDGRVGRFESPAAMVSLLCHYRVTYIDKRWTLFRRNVTPGVSVSATSTSASASTSTSTSTRRSAPFDACAGPSFELKSLIGTFGQRVDLDIEGLDDYLIVGRFDGFEVTNQTRLQELATRPAQFWFRIGDRSTGTPGRFVPATAGAPHILSVPTCLRRKLGTFDSGLFTNFAVFDAPPKSKRATSKDRAKYRVRLEALPFSCPVG